ncbi:MAG: hypothetical protein PVF50_11250 [Gammaproteobacteria bacterium]|jgi:hypothetical protein
MRHVVVSALVAAVVTGIVLALFPSGSADDSMDVTTIPAAPPAGLRLTVSDALPEDVWLDGARQAGDDHRILTSADNSICFITRIDVRGIAAPDDAFACSMEIDDFTGFWDLVVSVEEGSQANVRCNARCLTWE